MKLLGVYPFSNLLSIAVEMFILVVFGKVFNVLGSTKQSHILSEKQSCTGTRLLVAKCHEKFSHD